MTPPGDPDPGAAPPAAADDVAVFEGHRARLLALAYRMLGDVGRAEDVVQDAWLRWHAHAAEARSPEAYLVTLVTRLCLNELDSPRIRREERRGDRLPEPVDLDAVGLARLEILEMVSMAFLVVLQRLSPAERAVLLLHDVFDFGHDEIAALVGKSAAACRKLLERARDGVAAEKRLFSAPRAQHERLLTAFIHAASAGDVDALAALLADDVTLVTDGGIHGRRAAGVRNLTRPLEGAPQVAAFVVAVTRRNVHTLAPAVRDLNGQPALVLRTADGPFGAILLAVHDDRIHRVFFHGDPERLGHLGLDA
ncbi:MAG TPA: sigma factor [Kofleriaceae bacterium]|jgi:RNA polymerase sigma-70 factor (ECF subfamily)|nr:sigma factor [Kofleriaceae bacterium]